MKLSKLMLAVVAIILIVGFFCVNTFMREGGGGSAPVGGDRVLEDAPVQRTDASQSAMARAEAPAADVAEADDSPRAGPVAAAKAQERVRVSFTLPKPAFEGTPREIKGAFNLEPPREGRPRDAIIVPVGCDVLLSRDCKVTSSDPDPIVGELFHITDGDKDWEAYVELAPGTQWVQIDLERECEIYAACVWHYHAEPRVYRDVICQISNDPDFLDGVVTVFNNDHDNSSNLGVGKDKEYIETREGRPFPINAVKGRYVRFYSRGNASNEMNHYIEIEIYGRGD